MRKAYLVLQNGQVFSGYGFGAENGAIGELCFTTGVCGYVETLTDESYYGQIVLQTFPMIGNYGVCSDDFEGNPSVKGYVVREWCENPSNFRCEQSVDEFLKSHGIPGIYGVDTREITKTIREYGVMNAAICSEIPTDLTDVINYKIESAIKNVTTDKEYTVSAENEKYKVTLIDYGAKHNIIRELNKRGCTVRVVPCTYTAEQILSENPDGVMLSNGPGDPAENTQQIEEIKKLFGKIPMFGICLGHQLLALSNGAKTVKLKYGHRGANQPVKEVDGCRTFITSQNHGYAVVGDNLKNGKVSFINANDKTVEGVDYSEFRAFSVQFHPEACGGPHDSAFLFDRFIDLMGGDR